MTEPATLLAMGYAADLLAGDPRSIPHPVSCMGRLISRMERAARAVSRSPSAELIAGAMLAAILVTVSWLITHLVTEAVTEAVWPLGSFGKILLVWLTSCTLATRGLMSGARAVILSVRNGDTEDARKKLSMIVGRDTTGLDDEKTLAATVETLAENASDGVIAPLFYFIIGGLPLAMAYKAVNTLDSMLGYRDSRYMYLGRASARLDDIANFIPARITGILIAASAFILPRADAGCALRILGRDGRNHPSPNSGMPEAAMAGALGVRLGGPSRYRGVLSEKPFIGDPVHALTPDRADAALRLTMLTSLLGFLFSMAALFLAGDAF